MDAWSDEDLEEQDDDDESLQSMIDEAKELSKQGEKRAAGTKFLAELIGYITTQSQKSVSGKNNE